MLSYTETPIQRINAHLLEEADIKLFVKREDLNHPLVSGNKWWKLKYNIAEAFRQQHDTLLTFGGAYSNHIFATAAAANELGLKSIGVIRGEETLPLNPVLTFAKQKGMQLQYISRDTYRRKSEPDFIERLKKKPGAFYLIPEGGTNHLAIRGCAEFGNKLSAIEFDYVCLPVGTGGTMAGIIAGLEGRRRVLGFSSLKGGNFLHGKLRQLVFDFSSREFLNWKIETQYHFGGYAKTEAQLKEFIDCFQRDNPMPLDQVYMAKMMFGILDQIRQKKIPRGSIVLALHTGGFIDPPLY